MRVWPPEISNSQGLAVSFDPLGLGLRLTELIQLLGRLLQPHPGLLSTCLLVCLRHLYEKGFGLRKKSFWLSVIGCDKCLRPGDKNIVWNASCLLGCWEPALCQVLNVPIYPSAEGVDEDPKEEDFVNSEDDKTTFVPFIWSRLRGTYVFFQSLLQKGTRLVRSSKLGQMRRCIDIRIFYQSSWQMCNSNSQASPTPPFAAGPWRTDMERPKSESGEQEYAKFKWCLSDRVFGKVFVRLRFNLLVRSFHKSLV